MKRSNKINPKFSLYIKYCRSSYSHQYINDFNIICYYSKICGPQILHRHVLDWYYLCLDHLGGDILATTIQIMCYWKGPVTQLELSFKLCKICQQFNNHERNYGHLTSKIIAEIKLWNLVHIDLVVTYEKSIRQQNPGSAII